MKSYTPTLTPSVAQPEYLQPVGPLFLPDEVFARYEALIFDLDGTLIDSMKAYYNA